MDRSVIKLFCDSSVKLYNIVGKRPNNPDVAAAFNQHSLLDRQQVSGRSTQNTPITEHEAGIPPAHLPLEKEPEECLKLELRDAGEVDRVRVGCTLSSRGADLLVTLRKGEHRTEDERILRQEVPVYTKETILDLQRYCESEVNEYCIVRIQLNRRV